MAYNPFDPNFVEQQRIASLRSQADAQFELQKQQFIQGSVDWINANLHNRDLGLPLTQAPVPPKHLVYDDKGVSSLVEDPSLKTPVLPPPVPPGDNSLRPPASVVPPDRLDQLISMVRAIASFLKVPGA